MKQVDAIELDAEVKKLRAQRRYELPTDEFITEYDGVDDDGHKYREYPVPGPEGTTNTRKSDQTAMYQPAPSVTGSMSILVLEAKLLDGGKDLKNPHIPNSKELLERARSKLDGMGLQPAWNHRL